jgi:hypothetical protein
MVKMMPDSDEEYHEQVDYQSDGDEADDDEGDASELENV